MWGTPQGPQQDKTSTLSRTEEWCGLRLPDHCVSKGWAKPYSRLGVRIQNNSCPKRPLASQLLQGPSRGELNSKMSCPLSNQGCLTLERTGLPSSHIPTLNQIIQWGALEETENGISQSGCCEAGLCSHPLPPNTNAWEKEKRSQTNRNP